MRPVSDRVGCGMETSEPRQDTPRKFVATLPEGRELEWLKLSLAELGSVVPAASDNLDEVLGLLDLSNSPILFVGVNRNDLARASALIEGVLASRPLLTVVAVGEGMSQDELLTAMRAGARDFLTVGSRASEARALVRRLLERVPTERDDHAARGRVLAVASARPGFDNAFFAAHLAMAIRHERPGTGVLLLDLGIPPADTLGLLALESSFTFFDAVRNLRRLDHTLLASALPTHDSGLQVLAMPEEEDAAEEVTTAELYLLLGALKRHYSHVVVNLGGLPPGGFLQVMLGNADEVILLADQSVPGCRQNLRRLEQMREAGTQVQSLRVVVDRYQPRTAPDAATVAAKLGAPLAAVLRADDAQRLRAINLGRTLFELAPRAPYARAVRELVSELRTDETPSGTGGGWLRRLTGGMG